MIKLKNIVSEMSLDNFELKSNEFIDKFYNDLIAGNLPDEIDNYIVNYKMENDYDDIYDEDDNEEIEKSKDFENWLKYELEMKYDEVSDRITDLIENNELILYRKMTVDNDWIEKLNNNQVKRLGTYWSYEEDAAEAHWGYTNSKDELLLVGKININYIDWAQTFSANLYLSTGEEEKEITLFKNTPIEILEIYYKDEKIKIPDGVEFKI